MILRKITGSGTKMNFELGTTYNHIDFESSPEDFKRLMETHKYFESEKDNIYGFVTGSDCTIHALFKEQQNYIMSSNGETFEKLNYLI